MHKKLIQTHIEDLKQSIRIENDKYISILEEGESYRVLKSISDKLKKLHFILKYIQLADAEKEKTIRFETIQFEDEHNLSQFKIPEEVAIH